METQPNEVRHKSWAIRLPQHPCLISRPPITSCSSYSSRKHVTVRGLRGSTWRELRCPSIPRRSGRDGCAVAAPAIVEANVVDEPASFKWRTSRDASLQRVPKLVAGRPHQGLQREQPYALDDLILLRPHPSAALVQRIGDWQAANNLKAARAPELRQLLRVVRLRVVRLQVSGAEDPGRSFAFWREEPPVYLRIALLQGHELQLDDPRWLHPLLRELVHKRNRHAGLRAAARHAGRRRPCQTKRQHEEEEKPEPRHYENGR